MTSPLIALFDVGKTNTKLSLIDPYSNREHWSARRSNQAVNGSACRQLDTAGTERWLIEALNAAPDKVRIEVIVPVAHGAAAVLLDTQDTVLAAPDYEDACYEQISAIYDKERDEYRQTFSPGLPLGLNLGRQLFFLQHTQSRLFERTARLLLYPQFWAWRLSGIASSEVTSLGCHTDLWLPREMAFSALARKQRWTALLPPTRFAGDRLGRISASIAAESGLDPACEVACGIHDSNASYLRFLIGRERRSFAVVSSGTWTIVMAQGADLARLEQTRDMLANVSAFGAPVSTARFMGGREYELIAQSDDPPTLAALQDVLRSEAVALPSFANGGPFPGLKGRLINADSLTGSGRASLATLYVALMTASLIDSLGVEGEVLVDGPLAKNPLFGSLLACFAPGCAIKLHTDHGTSRAAIYLARFETQRSEQSDALAPLDLPGLTNYQAAWLEHLAEHKSQ